MNLLIDSGNSFLKWALATDDSFVAEGRCRSSAVPALSGIWKSQETPERVIVSNVAGEVVAGEIRKVVHSLWRLDTEFIVSSQRCCGLENNYHIPEQLGVDRWMAMVMAYRVTQGPVIIVDCGTAITIDLVNKNGLFLGGVIMPGINTAYDSLRTGTDVVDEISKLHDVSPVSHSTEEGVAAGVVLGIAGGIERVVREQSLRLDRMNPVVVLTGGDAEKIVRHLSIPVDYQVNLVLQGLRIFAESGD